MTDLAIYQGNSTALDNSVPTVGQQANNIASKYIFESYLQRKSQNTIRAQYSDLQTFCEYLSNVGIETSTEALQTIPDAWQFISWGLIEGFVKWMLSQGYSTSTVNRKLSTVKVYTKLAFKADVITPEENSKIRLVSGYTNTDATHIDEKREVTRLSNKKEESNFLSPKQYFELVDMQDDSPAGIRNKVILGLLFEYGLRVNEAVALPLSAIDLNNGTMRIYRKKTGVTTLFDLLETPDFYRLLKRYIENYSYDGQVELVRASLKSSELVEKGLSTVAVFKMIQKLGKSIGIDDLSPHDARHTWAQLAIDSGANLLDIQRSGGWKTNAMLLEYADKTKKANKGINVMSR